jgi:molecular chaperone DnaJ
MAAVNDAYRVLGDPARRAAYDREQQSPSSTSPTGTAPDPLAAEDEREFDGDDVISRAAMQSQPSRLAPAGPARMPWRLMLVMAVLGSAFMLITASLNDPPSVEPPDGIIRVGSCVAIETNGDVREVACTNTEEDTVVSLLLPTGATCPVEMAPHRDRLGLGTACIAFD